METKEIMPPQVYPGVVSRQELYDYCRSFLPDLEKRNAELIESIEVFEKRGDVHTTHALYEGLQENYGFQKALRQVCEWAKENMMEQPPIDPVDPVDLVKERKALREHMQ